MYFVDDIHLHNSVLNLNYNFHFINNPLFLFKNKRNQLPLSYNLYGILNAIITYNDYNYTINKKFHII